MKRFFSTLLAVSSLLWLVAAPMLAASRPRYGGTLRIAVREAPQRPDPAALSAARLASLSGLVFETLIGLDDRGRPQPLLATSWQSEPGSQRWRFILRGGVSFHDGTPLDANIVASSLRASNPEWKVLASGDSVMIETEVADPELPAELALARNSIVRRNDGKLSGTGPFAIARWDAGKHLTLIANDQYWAGRPFLDSVEIDFGKNDREQMVLLDLSKADVIEIAAENIQRARTDGRIVVASEPQELMALVFAHDPGSEDETHARTALALSVDTAALTNVVLQGGGEPTGALLPNWLSGYALVFADGGNADRSHQERTQAKHPSWRLGYDASDSVAHVIAEHVMLNARDAGIALQLNSSPTSDLRLVRIELPSSEPHVALTELAKFLQLPQPKLNGSAVGELYSEERALLESHRVIPLLYLRRAVALRPNVRGWSTLPDGSWQLSNVWLTAEKP